MGKAVLAVLLLWTAFALAGCRTTDEASECRGEYVPVNGAGHDGQEERA